MPTLIHLGIIVCDDHIPAWAHAALERVRQLDHVSIDVILRQTPSNQPFFEPRYALHRRYLAFENRHVQRTPDAFALLPLAALLPDVPVIETCAEEHHFQVDVWVALNDGNSLPHVSPRYGIWTFTHGGYPASHSAWDGLYELLSEQFVVESTIQTIAENTHNRLILARTYSAIDRLPVNRSRNTYYWKSAMLLARALQSLQRQGPEAFFANAIVSKSEPPAPLSNRNFVWNFTRFLVRTLPRYAYRALTFKQWLLLYSFSDQVIPESYKTFMPLMPPRDRLWADPQVMEHNGQYYIFVEEKLHSSSSGHLSVIVMDDQGRCQPSVPILQKGYHLSYPFIFTWQGNWYMIPETSEHRAIDVYRCTVFPDRWEYTTTLMGNCTAYDTTLLHHESKWWLFTCLQEMPGTSSWGDELFLFYADNPLSQQWQPHSQNPIVSDIRSARPAGPLFYHEGQLYRPSQDSANGYGHRLKFNRVLALNETTYHEETVHMLTPDDPLDGIHSYSRAQRLTLLDMRTRWFRWPRQIGTDQIAGTSGKS